MDHLLLPRRSSPRDSLDGYTLVEVVVAMLISCIMITAVFGVALTSKQGAGVGMRRIMADQGIAQLSAMLKGYVTACGCIPSSAAACPSPGCTQILGPNTLNGGVASWNLNTPGSSPPIVDAATPGGPGRAVYALYCGGGGNHYITGLSPQLEAPPYNGYFLYNVSWPGNTCPTTALAADQGNPIIKFSANWTEP